MSILGETTGFWLQTGAFFVSAIGAIYVIYANGRQARVRATIDLVLHQKQDHELTDARAIVIGLHRNGEKNLSRYLADVTQPEYKAIQTTLNNYEFIASGIRETAFDEEIYKRMRYSILIKDWNALHSFIIEIRTQLNIKSLYQEFEWLACKWLKTPLKNDNKD
ncbi:MAG: protein of unknown function (DUF4760) [Candidatus Nitrotoga sp. LAW]|nr:MAG: protein of unknown function (DUF4760) [Candidatus Nitrotoga sp. LAW]